MAPPLYWIPVIKVILQQNNAYLFLDAFMEKFDLERAQELSTALWDTSNLGQERDGRRLPLCKDVDVVSSHTLLCNKHLFLAVDYEVSSWIVGAFIEVKLFWVRNCI